MIMGRTAIRLEASGREVAYTVVQLRSTPAVELSAPVERRLFQRHRTFVFRLSDVTIETK